MKRFASHISLTIVLFIGLFSFLTTMESCRPARSSLPFSEVTPVTVINGGDTLTFYELHFYQVADVRNSMKLLYNEFGPWDLSLYGRYEDQLPQLVWNEKALFQGGNAFTIAASGTETSSAYFATLSIVDAKQNDALAPNHPNRPQLIAYFNTAMRKLKPNREFIQVFENYRERLE